MSSNYQRYSTLFSELDKNTVIVTSTSRLKNNLISIYLSHYIKDTSSLISFETPIITIQGMTGQLWDKLASIDINLPNSISKHQERYLWIDAISNDNNSINFNLNKTAKMAQSAWDTVIQWRIPLSELSSHIDNNNTKELLLWMKRFKNLLGEDRVTSSELLELISNHLQLKDIFKYQKLVYVGFDTITPQFNYFLEMLLKLGVKSNPWKLDTYNTKINVYNTLSDNDEFYHVASQVKDYIQANPHHKVSIICPTLQQNHQKITSVFDEVMGHKINIDNAERNYTISGGYALFDVPLINDLFAILSLQYIDDYENISQVLLSPYILDADKYHEERRVIDLYIRSNSYREISLFEYLSEQYILMSKDYISCFFQFASINTKGKYDWETIIRIILQLLGAFSWPGLLSLSSEDYQAVEQLYALFDILQSLQVVSRRKVSFLEGIHKLKILAKETIFQPESNIEAPINILGILEASCLISDHMWCLQMGQDSWPSFSFPNPLIPRIIAKEYKTPHCTIEHELEVATEISFNLLNQSPEVTLSYCSWIDGGKQGLSSLFSISYTETLLEESVSNLMKSEHNLRNYLYTEELDAMSPLVLSNPFYKGGSELLKDIARCNYRAICKHRLLLKRKPNYSTPMNPMQKGNILHDTLERFWREVKSLRNLLSLTDVEVNNLIDKYIEQSLKDIHIPEDLNYVIDIEKFRLQSIIKLWLSYEKNKRLGFTVVSVEQKINIPIDGLVLKIKIDRIDRLEGGGIVIIDYKTTKRILSEKSWSGDILDPQLPLYAISSQVEEVEGICYAQINRDNQKLVGITSFPSILHDSENNFYKSNYFKDFKSWESLLIFWKEQIERNIERFKRGNIQLTITDSSDIPCNNCDYNNLCRSKNYLD